MLLPKVWVDPAASCRSLPPLVIALKSWKPVSPVIVDVLVPHPSTNATRPDPADTLPLLVQSPDSDMEPLPMESEPALMATLRIVVNVPLPRVTLPLMDRSPQPRSALPSPRAKLAPLSTLIPCAAASPLCHPVTTSTTSALQSLAPLNTSVTACLVL